jgi:hypothetical protein
MRLTISIIAMAAGVGLASLTGITRDPNPSTTYPSHFGQETRPPKPEIYLDTYVTGYTTVVSQTDATPCIAASGSYICGRRDTVACPPMLKFGTVVEIRGTRYVCEDRTARKYRGRFDINCDTDSKCPFKVAGRTMVKVLLEY